MLRQMVLLLTYQKILTSYKSASDFKSPRCRKVVRVFLWRRDKLPQLQTLFFGAKKTPHKRGFKVILAMS